MLDWIRNRVKNPVPNLSRRQMPTVPTAPNFKRQAAPERPYVYAAHGCFSATERLCIHTLSAFRFEGGKGIAGANRVLAQELLKAERRERDRHALEHLLAFNAQPSHWIEFGYRFQRDNSYKELFRVALNFQLAGYDADTIAAKCCGFMVFVAAEQSAYLDTTGTIRPPPLLTQSKTFTRVFWLTAIFRHYRQFWNDR